MTYIHLVYGANDDKLKVIAFHYQHSIRDLGVALALSEFEVFAIRKQVQQFCDGRNQHYPADQLKIDFKYENQAVMIFESRPHWQDKTQRIESPVAKLRYVKSSSNWSLYWQRQNMKWQKFEGGENRDLKPLLELIDSDPYQCFWS